jgi:hypothetical protein
MLRCDWIELGCVRNLGLLTRAQGIKFSGMLTSEYGPNRVSDSPSL